MRAYWAILSARFRLLLQYRGAAIAGFGTQLFWGLIRVMIFEAFYRSTARPQPMSVDETITYLWLGQAFFALLPWQADPDVRAMIRTGTVAYEMLRPVDLYWLWYSRAVAARTAPTLLRAVPMFAVATLFLGMKPPPSWGCALAWAGATLGAVVLACAFSLLLTISLLWTLSGEGMTRLAPTVVLLFSGMLIPLVFFPAWMQPALDFLPFRDMVDVPFRVYLGHIPAAQYGAVFAHQAVWSVVLIGLGRALLARGSRRLVVQGG